MAFIFQMLHFFWTTGYFSWSWAQWLFSAMLLVKLTKYSVQKYQSIFKWIAIHQVKLAEGIQIWWRKLMHIVVMLKCGFSVIKSILDLDKNITSLNIHWDWVQGPGARSFSTTQCIIMYNHGYVCKILSSCPLEPLFSENIGSMQKSA